MSRDIVVGDNRHGGVDEGFPPVKIGGVASTSTPTAVDNGDRVNAYFDEYGNLHVVAAAGSAAIGKLAANSGVDIGDVDARDLGCGWTSSWTYTASADMTTAAALTAAPTSGQYLVIDDIIFSTDTAMSFEFEIETAATVNVKVYCAANTTMQITPRGKWKLATADKKLFGDASVAGNVAVTVFFHSEA